MAKKYTAMDHRRALMLFLDGEKIAGIARTMQCSRQTITKWAAEGFPIEITGGKTWKEFRTEERSRAMQVAQARAAERATESSLEFFETAKEDVKALFEHARNRLMSGEGQLNFSDVEKLLNVFIRLDNQAADRVLWMQDVLRKVFTAVVNNVESEKEIMKVRSALIGIGASETQKLGGIPGKAHLPTPVEMVEISESQEALLITPGESLSHS